MWRPVGCPRLPRLPLARARVVPLVVPLVPWPQPVVALFLAGGAGLGAEVPASLVLRPKLAQMLVLEVALFRRTGALPFWLQESVPVSW